MTAIAVQPGFSQETFDAFLATRDEPQWLVDLRHKCWELFESLPMPGNKDEEWMRTDIRTFRLDKFAVPGELAEDPVCPAAIDRWCGTRRTGVGTR